MKYVKRTILSILILPSLLISEDLNMQDQDTIYIFEERPAIESGAGQKTVIEKETWERKGARTVAEAVHLTPGVTVSRSGTTLDNSTVSIRGAGGEQVLVMINGIPLNNGKGDPVNLSTLSLNNITEIEIIRGGNSAVYGEGAFGGVINLIQTEEPVYYSEGDIYIIAGSFQTYTGGGSFKLPLSLSGNLTADLAGEYRRTEGAFDYESRDGSISRRNSQGWADNISNGLDWNVGGLDRHRASLDVKWYEGERGVPGLMEFLTPDARLADSRLGLSTRYRFKGYVGQTLDAEYSLIRQTSCFSSEEESVDDKHENLSHRGRLDLSYKKETGSWSFTPLLGGVCSYDSMTSTSLMSSNGTTLPGEANQTGGSLYGRLEFSGKNITITPAGRWDFSRTEYMGWDNSEDDKASWSLTTVYSLPSFKDKISLKGNTGTAYHSPGFDDLFWSGGSFAEGNPDLLPEESFNWDAGLYVTPLTGLEISTVYFQSYTENLIQWLPTAGGTWRPSNIGRAEGSGLENSLSWLIPLKEEELIFIELSGSYSWMNIIEKTEESVNLGNQLPYRPVHSASGSLSITKDSHSLTVNGRFMGQRYTNMANTKDLDSVLTFDTVLKLVFESGFYSSFSLLNMGDIQYIDKLGYPIPGRELSLKGGFRF